MDVYPCRTPLQYLTSSSHWRDFVLAVGPGVLIPRPETEQLIDFAQEVWILNPQAISPDTRHPLFKYTVRNLREAILS